MKIPSKIDKVLSRDAALESAVKLSIAAFEPWLEGSKMPFFIEYTDHGPTHLEAVLLTVGALITDEAHSAFSASDAAVLVLSVLLHDSAMHLSEDGFVSLMGPDNMVSLISGFDDRPWPSLWEDFLAEASRWDGRKLKRILGDTDPIRRPPLDPLQMTLRDRMVIGEFVRRHHPRLAHEIALSGVPGPNAKRLCLRDVPPDFADLAGLVARSHGMTLRSCFGYLTSEYNNVRTYKSVHAIYLMAVLRVADYLQIDSERAPQQVLQVRQLRSPISQGEFRAHHAIRDIQTEHEDPESIFVDARPLDVETYLKIKQLLTSIQNEIDSSWAVLGEVYGRYNTLRVLSLSLRRVRSNLDEEAEFAKTVEFVPCRAAFESADPDLLKLLVGPLYGDKPEIGIRELVQNAVDAVRELEQYRKRLPDGSEIALADQEADVVVSLDTAAEGGMWLTVSDRGIGMSADTLRGYFLKAGASFRRSDAWRKRFEDEQGKSTVMRSGRFGIGVLAAFLLGDEIHVSTRHVDEPEEHAVEFRATLDTEAIELRRCKRPIGTTIRVRLSNLASKELINNSRGRWDLRERWDWYCLSEPTVMRRLDGKLLSQSSYLPMPSETIHGQWRLVSIPDFEAVYWTYGDSPALVCNGILISQSLSGRTRELIDEGVTLQYPKISVFDNDGLLKLDLQRTDTVQAQDQLAEYLRRDVLLDLFAFALASADSDAKLGVDCGLFNYSGFEQANNYRKVSAPWLFTKRGICLVDSRLMRTSGITSMLVFPCPDNTYRTGQWTTDLMLAPRESAYTFHDYFTLSSKDSLAKYALTGRRSYDWAEGYFDLFGDLPFSGARLLVEMEYCERITTQGKIGKTLASELRIDWQDGDWVCLCYGKVPEQHYDFRAFIERYEQAPFRWSRLMAERYLVEQPDNGHQFTIAEQIWHEVFGKQVIPYDLAERREKLAGAYDTLRPYIEAREAEATAQSAATELIDDEENGT